MSLKQKRETLERETEKFKESKDLLVSNGEFEGLGAIDEENVGVPCKDTDMRMRRL